LSKNKSQLFLLMCSQEERWNSPSQKVCFLNKNREE
jgi:hypothetical protein